MEMCIAKERIEKEEIRLSKTLWKDDIKTSGPGNPLFDKLHAARQALTWILNPDGNVAPPYNAIMGIKEIYNLDIPEEREEFLKIYKHQAPKDC